MQVARGRALWNAHATGEPKWKHTKRSNSLKIDPEEKAFVSAMQTTTLKSCWELLNKSAQKSFTKASTGAPSGIIDERDVFFFTHDEYQLLIYISRHARMHAGTHAYHNNQVPKATAAKMLGLHWAKSSQELHTLSAFPETLVSHMQNNWHN